MGTNRDWIAPEVDKFPYVGSIRFDQPICIANVEIKCNTLFMCTKGTTPKGFHFLKLCKRFSLC